MQVDERMFTSGRFGGCSHGGLWVYPTDDPIEAVLTPGYFDVLGVLRLLKKGDRLWVHEHTLLVMACSQHGATVCLITPQGSGMLEAAAQAAPPAVSKPKAKKKNTGPLAVAVMADA